VFVFANVVLQFEIPQRNKVPKFTKLVSEVVEFTLEHVAKHQIYFSCCLLLTFAKGSDEFVIVASCKSFISLYFFLVLISLYFYQYLYSSYKIYSKWSYQWKAVGFNMFNNTIYVIINKPKIGELFF
jgi:hypothetical protein